MWGGFAPPPPTPGRPLPRPPVPQQDLDPPGISRLVEVQLTPHQMGNSLGISHLVGGQMPRTQNPGSPNPGFPDLTPTNSEIPWKFPIWFQKKSFKKFRSAGSKGPWARAQWAHWALGPIWHFSNTFELSECLCERFGYDSTDFSCPRAKLIRQRGDMKDLD